MKKLLSLTVVVLLLAFEGKAQRISVSSDVLKWATLSPNVGVELAFSRHHAFSFSAAACPFRVSDRLSITHLTVIPEYKYWLNMPFYGHYLGANLLYSSYKATGSRHSGSGNIIAACANYGYSFILGDRWNVAPFVGLGVGADIGQNTRFIPLVARIGINIQLVVK